MNQPAVGFVGFGEAGSNIAKGLKAAGISRVSAFDIHRDTPKLGDIIRRRADEAGIPLVNSNQDLAASSDVLFSTVTCARAKESAGQTAPFLKPHHIYADLNSVSPALKQEIEAVIARSGAGFAKKAITVPTANNTLRPGPADTGSRSEISRCRRKSLPS